NNPEVGNGDTGSKNQMLVAPARAPIKVVDHSAANYSSNVLPKLPVAPQRGVEKALPADLGFSFATSAIFSSWVAGYSERRGGPNFDASEFSIENLFRSNVPEDAVVNDSRLRPALFSCNTPSYELTNYPLSSSAFPEGIVVGDYNGDGR